MKQYRILLTSARAWTNEALMEQVLADQQYQGEEHCHQPVLIHGNAVGGDRMAERLWFPNHWQSETYSADLFDTPLMRNLYMVNLGADVCISFALKWASGTGHCARAARRAGIPTIDYGVDTQ